MFLFSVLPQELVACVNVFGSRLSVGFYLAQLSYSSGLSTGRQQFSARPFLLDSRRTVGPLLYSLFVEAIGGGTSY